MSERKTHEIIEDLIDEKIRLAQVVTLRDQFAIGCPRSIIDDFGVFHFEAEIQEMRGNSGRPLTRQEIMILHCKMRYEYADIMLAEREKK